ncbi:hypothetical protein ALO_16262 [Acetonema longum DSM 6540]|uniref:Uncharacterized protein n=1 Tax=Acetonema longum DSM 6540 TaxID=1009370 RepID=F7NME5_9FIRM|nr:hypothetical protein ALO_16262 [Acetonema longum DSM 6540]
MIIGRRGGCRGGFQTRPYKTRPYGGFGGFDWFANFNNTMNMVRHYYTCVQCDMMIMLWQIVPY